MRARVLATFATTLTVAAAFFMALPAPVHAASPRVAIIVGPVGDGLTQRYIEWANESAAAASSAGATVVKAYSPNATASNVLAAVQGANIIIYFGHGSGFPNPYSATLDTSGTNGWGLQGPNARGTHEHNWADGTLKYYGEAWITANARPAPGFVMIYSNACYAPGASEGWDTPATEAVAKARVGYYSRGVLGMGAGAYFATDIGASSIVSAILRQPNTSFGDIFKSHRGFSASGLRTFPHPNVANRQVWLDRTANHSGDANYFYAFAGDPNLTPSGSGAVSGPPGPDTTGPLVLGGTPAPSSVGVPTNTSVRAWFNENVTGVSAGNFVLRDTASGAIVPASVWYDPGSWTAGLDPYTPLVAGRSYTAAVSGSVRDAAGNPLPWTTWRFTTAVPPPPGSAAEVYSPARSMAFAAGTHVGYRFDGNGVVLGSKSRTLSAPSGASATERRAFPGQPGMWLKVADGIWAGHWVRESESARLSGVVGHVSFAPRTVSFTAGTHTGYQFASSGSVAASKRYTLATASAATANARVVVNGVSYVAITNGVWAGYWVRESSAVTLL